MANATALPNPNTPLAFLPPRTADQFEASRYVHVATCGMFVWDILLNLRNDYRLLTQFRLGFPTVVYFLSRIASFTFIITSMVGQISPIDNCQTLQVAIAICFAVAVPSTSMLFFLRVRAIFLDHRWTVAFFAFLWTATLAGCITVPFATTGGHLGPTKYCVNVRIKPYSSAGVIISAVNDTLVFFWVSWRLTVMSRSRLRSFVRGEGLSDFMWSLLRTGQEYYIITVVINVLTMAMILSPNSLPAVLHGIFTSPNVAITNSMACRIYRNVKFGTTVERQAPTNAGSLAFVPTRRADLPQDVELSQHYSITAQASIDLDTRRGEPSDWKHQFAP